jgi:hypothetical protein
MLFRYIHINIYLCCIHVGIPMMEFVEGVLTTRKYFPDRAYYDGCTQSLDSILRRVYPNERGN